VTLERLLAHPELVRLANALKQTPGREIEAIPTTRKAAIALVLRSGALDEPELLMIKRAEHENDPWSGHVACPGGRMEPGDRDLEQTAVRETLEETGVDLGGVGRVLGTLDDISPSTPALPPIVIRPFVAAVPSSVEIIQSSEVAAAFWVPLTALRASTAWGSGTVHVRGVERQVSAFTHGEYLVWGLTERVLKQLLERMSG
jgi:8-oxo-dGTP pyrophosphatase MutT (NUDIX family)